jgi:ATP-binding cassette subfamily B protein
LFKKYPFINQEGIKDCGCSSLLMIIKYYKGYISLNELRDMTKTSKNGTTAYHLIDTAKKVGFEAKGIKCHINDINKENMVLPCIAHVIINDSYKHYIVIYEINFTKKQMLIADPANKIKKLSFTEFDKIWSNVFIFLYPIQKIPTYKSEVSIASFIKNTIKTSKNLILSTLWLSIIVTGFSILTSFFLKYMLDSITLTNSKSSLVYIFVIFLNLYILKIISDFFRNKLLIYINQKIDLELTNQAFKQIVSLPYHYYCNRTTGEIVERISDLNLVRNMISKVALSLFVDLPLTIFSFIFLYFISNTLFFISIIIFLLYCSNIIFFKPIFSKYIKKCQQKKAEVTSYMVESISGFETVKGLNIENKITSRFEKKYVGLLRDLFKFENYYNYQYLLKEIIHNLGFIFIIFLGCILVVDKKITFGELLTFNALLSYFLEPIRNITDLDININQAKSALKRVLELFYSKNETGIVNTKINGNIVFDKLNYTYNDRDHVLKDINLKINDGDKVMITGNSGCGKSTLLKILKGYYKTKRNQIIINDIDINEYSSDCYKEQVSYISQKEILFNDSLYNNLIVSGSYDESKVLLTAKICCVDEIVRNNSLGYKMLIEENGFNISGGEKQRIILARTLLKPFNLLLIDEGLNQVDINLERKILKSIFSKYKNKTIIIVSHRLENMDLYDKLVELKNGKIERIICRNE